jgi:hypothetical protein
MTMADTARHAPVPSWSDAMPTALVVACSDGRFQEQTDGFLRHELGLQRYDRLYLPGGPGALVPDAARAATAAVYRHDAELLIRLHEVRDVVLVFHGPAADGPDSAVCGGYRQAFPNADVETVRRQQEADARLLLDAGFGSSTTLRAYRADVQAALQVRFTPLGA